MIAFHLNLYSPEIKTGSTILFQKLSTLLNIFGALNDEDNSTANNDFVSPVAIISL